MTPVRVAMGFLFAFGAGHAMAQNCTTGTELTAAQINNLLNNKYACVGASPNAQWNELHSAGKVLDYKKGPSDPVDPSDTPSHPTGTYTVTGTGGPQTTGTITYNYGAGGTYGYRIRANLGTTQPNPGLYSFCTTTGGQNLAVQVQPGHC